MTGKQKVVFRGSRRPLLRPPGRQLGVQHGRQPAGGDEHAVAVGLPADAAERAVQVRAGADRQRRTSTTRRCRRTCSGTAACRSRCRGPRPSISSTSAITRTTSSAPAAAPARRTSTLDLEPLGHVSCAGERRGHRHDVDDRRTLSNNLVRAVPRLRQHQHQHGPLLPDVPLRAGVVQPPVQPRRVVRRELELGDLRPQQLAGRHRIDAEPADQPQRGRHATSSGPIRRRPRSMFSDQGDTRHIVKGNFVWQLPTLHVGRAGAESGWAGHQRLAAVGHLHDRLRASRTTWRTATRAAAAPTSPGRRTTPRASSFRTSGSSGRGCSGDQYSQFNNKMAAGGSNASFPLTSVAFSGPQAGQRRRSSPGRTCSRRAARRNLDTAIAAQHQTGRRPSAPVPRGRVQRAEPRAVQRRVRRRFSSTRRPI